MKVLVTDGDNRAALAIVRSLGRLGHEVLVGDRRSTTLAQTSRYCRERVVYPDPVRESDAFVDELARIARTRSVDAIVPVADITTFLVTDHRERFECLVPCAPAAVVRHAADKVAVMDTAQRIGVPTPRGIVVAHGEPLPDVETLGFPLVIKPWRSRIRTADGWKSTAVSYAASVADLTRDLDQRPSYEFPVLLQERIEGPGMGVFACYADGRPVALFSHRRLRERPPWGGVSVLSESVPVDPVAGGHATRLLDAIGWDGVAMVEFKRDLRDNTPRLMEINGRFWGSLQLAIDAGVDFPALLLRRAQGETLTTQPAYRVGIRERWFWGDVDSLLVTLFGHPPPPFRAQRTRAAFAFLKLAGRALHYDNPKRDDMAPFVAETRGWFRRLGEGLAARLGS